ncbi:MAG: UMP kinase [Clostridiaceae bacterium]|jgi:uridylate kinase|nr:UMP kinase [Bacillota bacterium]NLI39346.1 UMP kinase [Clostridiaceae bacterium]
MDLKYRRIMLKISGEALSGEKGFGIDQTILNNISSKIKEAHDMGVDIGIVVGGGNFWRGRSSTGMDRTTADHMGMLATVINALALQDALEERGVPTRVQTALEMPRVAETYIRRRAIRHIEKKRVVIFACGTGNPYFSTDTAAVLRAAEIEAEVILLAKNVDAVYDSDPKINPNALKYDRISFMDVLSKQLGVMDSTATSLCMDNNIPLVVFSIREPENIIKVLNGVNVGTFVAREV